MRAIHLICLLGFLSFLGCPKKKAVEPTEPEEVAPTFFSIPYGCNAALIVSEGESKEIDKGNATLLSADASFQWLTQDSLKVLILVITNEEQLQANYRCMVGEVPPASGIDFEKSRIYMLFIEHPKLDSLQYKQTLKSGEKMSAVFEVARAQKNTEGPTTVDLFSFTWPEEVRGMSLRFKFTKPQPQP